MREGSLSNQRALGANQASVRKKNTEGLAFQYNQINGSVQSKGCARTIEVFQVLITQCDHICEVENSIEPELAYKMKTKAQ